MKNNLKSHLLPYLLATFILTYGLGIYAHLQGGLEKFPAVIALQMFIPGLVTLMVILFYKERPIKELLGFRLPQMKMVVIGGLLMFVIMVLGFYVSSLFSTNYFHSLEEIVAKLKRANIPFPSDSPLLSICLLIGLNVFIGALVNLPLMLGEEIGWRAFMTPRLITIFGERGHLIAGVIWALWHAVIIAQGFNYPGYPVIGNLLFIFFCIPVGYLFYFFYQRSGSVWIPAIMHGIMNKTAGTFMDFFVKQDQANPLMSAPTGIIGIVLFSIIALFIYYRKLTSNFNSPGKA